MTCDDWYTAATGGIKAVISDTPIDLDFTLQDGDTLTLYARWKPRQDIAYTVHYYLSGRTTSLLQDKTVTGQTMEDTVTETAETIAGYTSDSPSKSLTLEATGNEIAA